MLTCLELAYLLLLFIDLPDEIPMPMVIGTKVTAKVPHTFDADGLNLALTTQM